MLGHPVCFDRLVREPRIAALLATIGLLTGCGADNQQSQRVAPTVAVAHPAGVRENPTFPADPATPTPPCDPLASFRPSGPLPTPGSMPAGSTMAAIVGRGTLRVGVDQNLNLFGSRDPKSGELRGYDIDYAREIALALFGDRDRVTFRTVTSANREEVLARGEIDLIANSMTITCDRKQRSHFSTNYFESGQRIMVPEDSTIQGAQDLANKRVCAPAGTTSIRTIAELSAKPVPVAVVDWTDCLVMLQQGQVDAISTTDGILIGLIAQDPTTKMVGERFTYEPHGLAISRGNTDFVRFVNAVLEQMRADGRWTAIYNKWLTGLGPAPAPPPAKYVD
jgi:polar amino acid transport system substrate-binding protein